MSAYICNPEHIALLAMVCAREKMVDGDQCDQFAIALLEENVASVKARYPNVPVDDLPGPCLSNSQTSIAVRAFLKKYRVDGVPSVSDADIVMMVSCYVYQSCEHEGWQNSPVAAVMERLSQWLAARIRVNPAAEQDSDLWDFEEDAPPAEVVALYAEYAAASEQSHDRR